MRRFLTLLSVVLTFSVSVWMQTAVAHDPGQIPGLVDRVIGAVVKIKTVRTADVKKGVAPPKVPEGSPFREFFQEPKGQEGKQAANTTETFGSGFVVDRSGLIATGNNVIKDASEISVSFNDGRTLKVEKIVGADPRTGLAVLRVDPGKPLAAAKFGDSSKVRVGQEIIAIGSPFGLGGSVTSGIVSALNRDIHRSPYDNFIQTDAAINKGNAGGPLFNLDGEVIGINTAILSSSGSSSGVGFAIPSNTAKTIIEQLIKYGEIRRGWLGVNIQRVTDEIAAKLKMKKATGALVHSVGPGSPAQKGGIEVGDVILTFDGKEIPEMRALPRIAANTEIGKRVDVRVLRNGKTRTLKVRIGRMPENPAATVSGGKTEAAPKSLSLLGLTVERLTDAARASHIGEDVNGVLVIKVAPGSDAAENNLKAGDVIVEVGQEAVKTPADFADKIGAAKKSGRHAVMLLVSDGKRKRFVALSLAGISAAPAAEREGAAAPYPGPLEELEKLQ